MIARDLKLLLFIFFCGYGICSGQYTFIRNISNGMNGIHGGAFVKSLNGDYFFNAAINTDNLILMKTDSNGIKLFENLVTQLPYNKVLLTDALYSSNFSLYMVNDQSFTNQPFSMLKSDWNGSPVSIRKHYLNTNSMLSVATTTKFGSIFLGGGIYDGNGTDTDMLVVKVDSNANVLWAKSISMPGSQIVTSISPTNNGSCVVIGTDSSGENRYVIRFTPAGTIYYNCNFSSVPNFRMRPVFFHEADSGKNYLLADFYRLLPYEKVAASVIVELTANGSVINQKAFKIINDTSSLFSGKLWIHQDPVGELHLSGWSRLYNSGPGEFYDAPYYIKLSTTLDIISAKYTPLFDCETTIVDMVRTGPDHFVQVLAIRDHYTSFPQIEEATVFRKFNINTNGCINTTPLMIYDTTTTMFAYLPLTTTLVNHTTIDSVFTLQGHVPSNYSIFGCTPSGMTELVSSQSVYPNPASERIYISENGYSGNTASYRIFDLQGKEVAAGEIENGSIEISRLSSQPYLLKIFNGHSDQNLLFVKSD